MAMTDMAVAATPPQQQLAKPKVKDRKGMVGYPVPPQAKARTGLDVRGPDKIEVELARQDVFRVCNPDFRRPFSSVEDACERYVCVAILERCWLKSTYFAERGSCCFVVYKVNFSVLFLSEFFCGFQRLSELLLISSFSLFLSLSLVTA